MSRATERAKEILDALNKQKKGAIGELELAVNKGIERMLSRGLENAPAADELEFVAEIFTDDLRNAGFTDAQAVCVLEAFEAYGRAQTTWPKPAELLQTVPKGDRQEVPAIEAPLPADLEARVVIYEELKEQRRPDESEFDFAKRMGDKISAELKKRAGRG